MKLLKVGSGWIETDCIVTGYLWQLLIAHV